MAHRPGTEIRVVGRKHKDSFIKLPCRECGSGVNCNTRYVSQHIGAVCSRCKERGRKEAMDALKRVTKRKAEMGVTW
jgi:hypothetical protein